MKRLLSLTLVLCMLISLIPAYAAPAEGGSGITVKYNFTEFEGAAKDVNTKGLDYDKTYGFWKHRPAGENRDAKLASNSSLIFVKYGPGNTISNEYSEKYTPDDYFVAYEINVPASGWYSVTLNNAQCNAYGATTQLYILPGEKADSELDSLMKEQGETYKFGNEFEFYNNDIAKTYVVKDEPLGEKYFEAGKHIVVYAATAKNGDTAPGNAQMNIIGITLDGGSDAVPMSLTSGLDNTVVAPNGGTAKMTVEAIMSDGTVEDYSDKVVYSATGNATVTQDGIITGGEEGEATVTATLELPGCDALTTSQTVRVANAGARIFYDIGYFSAKVVADGINGGAYNEAVRQATYKNTDGFYAYYDGSFDKNNTTTRYVRPRSSTDLTKGNLQLLSNVAVVYEVYIPVAGTYTMEMWNGVYNDAKTKEVKVYLSTIEEIEKNGGVDASLGTYIGSYPCTEEGVSGTFSNLVTKANIIPGFRIPEPGYYTIAFYEEGSNGSVGNFYLTSGTGKAVPMKKTITGLDTGFAEVEILLSDKTYMDLSDATLDWKSSDESVVYIDDDGIMDISKVGETKISVDIHIDGKLYDTVETMYTVTALPNELPCAETVQKYDFLKVVDWDGSKLGGYDKQESDDIRGITYAYTDGNWQWFGEGPAGRPSRVVTTYGSRLQLYPANKQWTGFTIKVDKAGKYLARLEYYAYNTAGDSDIYIVPKPEKIKANPNDPEDTREIENIAAVDELLHRKNYVGYANFINPAQSGWATMNTDLGVVDIPEAGEYVLVFKQGPVNGYLRPRVLTLDGINDLKLVSFTAPQTEVTYGKTVATSLSASLLDGTVLGEDEYEVLYESSDNSLATVDKNGVVTGKGHGEVTITATARKDSKIVQKSIVFNAIDDTDIIDKKIQLDESLYVGEKSQISVILSMQSGNKIMLPRDGIAFTTDKEDVLRFEEAGYVFAAKEANSVNISASGTFREEEITVDKEISVILDEGKTEATYYTTEKRATALENIETYDWAKSMKKSAEKTADEYISNLDIIYDMIIAEGLPRSIWRGAPSAPNYNICRYCDGGVDNKGSDFTTNVLTRPWQTQCPECKRLFPSNDFEGFLRLGLDREKRFSRIRALEAHRAMLLEMGKELPDAGITEARKAEIDAGDLITAEERAHYGFGVDGGYLVNILYPELEDPTKIPKTLNNSQGMRPGEDWKTWGVDDGWGYIPLREDGVTPYQYTLTSGDSVTYIQERHVYAAHINDNMMKDVIGAIDVIKDAYLYTGDIKYGRAGAIILDRIADVYHTYDLFSHNDIDYDKDAKGTPDRVWHNTDGGGTGIGIITGRIDANNQAQTLALCADAFYPVLTDTQVIDYLSEKAKKFGYNTLPDDDVYNYHEYTSNTGTHQTCDGNCREYEHEMRRNAKISSHDIWKNWENGILRKNYWGVKFGRIVGNFGQRQATTSITAIVQDRQPETTEMLDWIYQPVNPDGTYNQGGGGVTSQLIDVIDRDGMGHESSVNYNRTQIEGLGKMSDFLADYKDGEKYNLYENPKFREMFMAFVRPVVPEGHPKLGDASTTLFHGYYAGDIEIWKNGFKNLRDTDIADDLAQYIWTRNGRTTEGLHYDIFTENPESFEDEVAALIDETGKLKSELMAGWGFAVLQDGGVYTSASASTETNNQRAFWITAGDTDGHGHPDSLELNIDAFGLDLGADLAYPEETSYTANRLQWVGATISHNTVLINEKDSVGNETRGFPLHFNDSGMVKLMDIDATHKYAEAENYRRSLVMVKINDDVSYGVDFFRVTGGNHHTYIYHSASSKVNEVSGLSMATEPELIQVDKDGTMDYATYAGKDAAYVKNPDGSVRKALPGEEVNFETVFPVTYGQDPWTQPAWTYDTMFPRGYTWLRNVRRAAEPKSSFTVDFEITDYRKAISNPKGIHLRMTQINDFTPSGVAFAGGHVPQKSASSRNVGYKDAFDSERATMLEYVYIEREAPEGQELDSLFTTVYEPYRNTSNIEKIEAVDVSVASGTEQSGDMARAVKVTHVGGERIDYVVYATNNSVKYNVGGVFDFQGFVGVYSTNSEGAPTYRYVHDGNIIGGEVESEGTLTGKVEGFERNLAFKNYIDVSAEIEDTSALAGEYVYIDNDGAANAVYKIEGAKVLEEHSYGEGKNVIRLDIDRTTLIRGHQNASNPELGYIYNISAGQTFRIPVSYDEDFSPEFAPVNDSITTSAGSTISVSLSASSPVEENAPTITYIGTTLPRGASVNAETGVFTWKPDSSQIGENHVAITARDSDGRESTVHFTVTVYGSTTGGSSNSNNTETPSENTGTSGDTSTPAGGGGGGGGGGAAPTDTPNTDDESLLLEEKVPSTGEADEVENGDAPQFTDLGNHEWAADAINTLATDGIIKGTSASTFSPAANITRADFALLLVRAFELSSDSSENFADVDASDYFAPELAVARNTGIVNGVGDNKYAPRNTITRQDMMVITFRALTSLEKMPSPRGEGEPLAVDEVSYPDFATVADYAKDAVSTLISAGLVNGKSGRIVPNDYTTRAEVAVLIKRILDYIK